MVSCHDANHINALSAWAACWVGQIVCVCMAEWPGLIRHGLIFFLNFFLFHLFIYLLIFYICNAELLLLLCCVVF